MNQGPILLNLDSTKCTFLTKLYSPLGELSRRDYFWCAFFIFIPCKIVVYYGGLLMLLLAFQLELVSPGVSIKLRYLVVEGAISLITFTYPYFIIVVKRLRFVGYKSGKIAFFVFVIISMQGIISFFDLDLITFAAVHFVPPSILLFQINGK